jgi:hypothetical protein
MKNFEWKPLENRTYKHKDPKMEFFCPLCGTERAFHFTPRLSVKNYLQLTLCSLLTASALYPVMGIRSFFVFFIFWALFEAGVRMNFRKEIPCPHCGFDASWYKKDIKVARRLVNEFWQKQNPNAPVVADEAEMEELLDAVSKQRQEDSPQFSNY